ncbi:MAG: MFS transporter [Kouleothrix sp.]|jgi:DHA3 family tetracycline resistance protein-like MFS transporter|nr:MFS transporter [Kouleothrix sp.]
MFRRPGRLDASLVYIIMSGVATFASALMFTVLAVYYVSAVGMNPFQLVLVGTVLESVILLFEIPTGVVADTYSRRLSVIVGTFILGIAFVLEGALPLLAGVLAAEAIRGVGETFLSGATDAWLADEVGEEQVGRVYLRAAQVGRVVGILGVLASVGLASVQLALPVVLGGALYLALGVFLALCMPERGFRPAPREERASWRAMLGTFRAGARVVRASPVLLALLAVNLVGGAASEGFDRLWEAHMLLDFSFPSLGALKPVVWFGIINIGTAIVSMAISAVFQRRLDAISQSSRATARALLVLNGLIIASVITFALAGSFALAFAMLALKAVLHSLSGPLYGTWLIQQTSPQTRATVLSIGSQSNALGQTIGGPVVGAVGTIFSLRAALAVAGALLAPTLALYARTIRHAGLSGTSDTKSG